MRDMGVVGMDLEGVENWETCRRYGITPCMVQGAGFFTPPPEGSDWRFGSAFGWNKLENHERLLATARTNAEQAGL